ncbi:MAG TPA: hypothetical protein VFS24_15790 [Steroidobacteraceae bacterium]|nr:hypothetical protein [Steroidobacteraceae bacterium]
MTKSNGWLDVLRAAVARSSQRRVAKRIGVSDVLVQQVLAGTYSSRPVKLEAAVRKHLMPKRVCKRVRQLGDIDKALLARLKHYHRLYGTLICSRWWPCTPQEFAAYIANRSKRDATAYAQLVTKLGFPERVPSDEEVTAVASAIFKKKDGAACA